VRKLPRPLKSCGVVFLKSAKDSKSSYFRVRPKLVREALMWLILNNPLYKGIIISAQNLQALEGIDVDEDVPSVTITEDEVRELRKM
jgi:flagella basal body P-ring formation protein FlgA